MRLSAAEVAAITRGVVDGDSKILLTGAEVDTRLLLPGDLFVALPGARRDGHHYVADALQVASAALVRADAELQSPPEGCALIRVKDPLIAYHLLARAHCTRMPWRVAAVTGSVGKTTTKDFLATLLGGAYRTGASAGNRNNTLGLPAQLLRQNEDLELFVAEAGMSHLGELDQLGAILRPDLLMYTRIAPAHTEFFSSMDEVVRAKAELLPYLQPDGILVLNADDPQQQSFASLTTAPVRRYGGEGAEVTTESFEHLGLAGSRFTLVADGERAEVHLELPGAHQAENLLAAAAAATALGMSVAAIADRVALLKAAPHRGRLYRLASGLNVVDDSYNASPTAMARMLELLAVASGRRVAVLGEMFELGEAAPAAHRLVGAQAAASSDLLVIVGGEMAATMADAARAAGGSAKLVEHVADAAAAAERLQELVAAGDVVLVKASRGLGLERVVAALVGEEVD